MHLSWNTSGLGLVADTEHGEYSVFDTERMGYGGFGAFFRRDARFWSRTVVRFRSFT